MNPFAKRVAPDPIIPPIPEAEVDLELAVRAAIADESRDNDYLDGQHQPETLSAEEFERRSERKLSQLVDADFPFDKSQLAAVNGMVNQQYACLTGAAGTGKTTTEKKLVDMLLNTLTLENINMRSYFKSSEVKDDPDDDYEMPDDWIPAIAMVGFTGRSTQMIKKNFPRDWHGNIMTIHRLLAYVPEYYDDWDDEQQEYRKKMRFVPTYTADNLMPWDVVIIDEGGMLGLDLWHKLWAAMKPGCRVYMIGDINQLPPVHGRSVFGFAMDKWPSWELTHVHRQAGVNNPIVENAWRVLKGQMPVTEGNFQMLELPGNAQLVSRKIRGILPKLKDQGIYVPDRDAVITAINGEEGSTGFALGQLPLNRELATIFNPTNINPRFIIDGGRDKKIFAVGDKVMATKNDHEAGITNGMDGIITSIVANPAYSGDWQRFGNIQDVTDYLNASDDDMEEIAPFSLEDLSESFDAQAQGREDKKEKRDRGPSSHIISVRFGSEEHGFELPFATLSEVGSLMTSYVKTCHKMQGGECPVIIIILHDSHKRMHYREWLYTAITRASQKCILFYSKDALRAALNNQRIKGATLKEKIAMFNALQKDNGLGVAVKVILPDAEGEDVTTTLQSNLPVIQPTTGNNVSESLAGTPRVERVWAKPGEPAAPPERSEVHIHIHRPVVVERVVTRVEIHTTAAVTPTPEPKDQTTRTQIETPNQKRNQQTLGGELHAPLRLVYRQPLLLTYQPQTPEQTDVVDNNSNRSPDPVAAPIESPVAKAVNPWAAKLGKGR